MMGWAICGALSNELRTRQADIDEASTDDTDWDKHLMNNNLIEHADALQDYWSPKVVGELNSQYLKVAKVKGEFPWHKHDHEDELFIILQGSLTINFEDQAVNLQSGDAYVVPKGVMHQPSSAEECLIALVEPKSTQHTGDEVTEMTVNVDQQLAGFQSGGA